MKITDTKPIRTITVELEPQEQYIFGSAVHEECEKRFISALYELNFYGGFEIEPDTVRVDIRRFDVPRFRVIGYAIETPDWHMPEEDIVKAITSAFQV